MSIGVERVVLRFAVRSGQRFVKNADRNANCAMQWIAARREPALARPTVLAFSMRWISNLSWATAPRATLPLKTLVLAFGLSCTGLAESAALHEFKTVAIAPDGRHVASIEATDDGHEEDPPASLVVRDFAGHSFVVPLPCQVGPNCHVASPTWSRDGRLSYLLGRGDAGVTEIITLDLRKGVERRILSFAGPLERLRYGPDDRLAVLATANAHKNIGRTEAGVPLVGDIDAAVPDEQRIAVVEDGTLRFVSPPDLYVYEFDFLPRGDFVGTAAPGDGDSHWWIAKLYAFEQGQARVLFAPSPREQLATPVVAPDGKSVAFVGGWMSDFGSTGGDAYVLRLDVAGAVPTNLTPGLPATVTALDWHCGQGLTATLLAGSRLSLIRFDGGTTEPLWSGEESLSGGANGSISCGPQGAAAVSSSFGAAPEIVAGRIGHWQPITHENAGVATPFTARSVTWRNDGYDVQGWLLVPRADGGAVAAAGGAGAALRPMVVYVHGGPEAASTNRYLPETSTVRALLDAGWIVFEPNYRGSFGQGEAFAAASIQDLGGGDWRDVLSGVDAALQVAPIDAERLGLMGGSYGGYLTMWGVTQTHRFRAAVSHAGVSDWLSIEGEAPQAGSDQVNFGGSVYDNATPYLKASPIMYMRRVATPVLITVGERDLECPMAQSEEFFTALQTLGVPSDFYVYAGEGHALRKPENRADFRQRTVSWFEHWFGAAG
jgi:dipeptidyl aminopeptidase/acylaminoacyl peptidase